MTILMKRVLKVTFWVLFIAFDIIGIMALLNCLNLGNYTVKTPAQFETAIEFGEDINLDEIKIIDNRVFGMVEINLTKDMIVSIDDTSVAGHKTVVFEHNGEQFTVVFTIKYKVEFIANGEVIDTQMVVTRDELVPPTPVPKHGYEFSHWDYDFSADITDNIQINAVFSELEFPKIYDLSATYGDTLASLTLPANERGSWEFLDPAETPVGDAGRNTFLIGYRFNGQDSYYEYSSVEVEVAKRRLDFHVGLESFPYDGKDHFPTFTLDEDVDVITVGSAETLPGTYAYSFEIDDPNFTGSYSSSFEITRPTVTVTVSSATITYPEAVPEFTYTVEGFDNFDNILGIEIDAPATVSKFGEYEIGITHTNDNVNYVVHKGTLTVLKGDREVALPTLGTAVYEDRLGDVEFVGSYLGTWAWEDPNIIIDNMDSVTAWAVFTHADPSYNPTRVEVTLTGIKKRTLTFTVKQNQFTYDPNGTSSIVFELSGSTDPDIYALLEVLGNTAESEVGKYSKTLYVNDPRYDGSITVDLIIDPTIPATDFTKVYEKVWSEGFTLGDIALPDGYEWVDPDTVPLIGKHSYPVVFTPEDTHNYVSVNGQIAVDLGKAPTELEGVKTTYDKTYDTLKIDIKNSGIKPLYTDGTLTITYYKDGTEVDEILNAGTYKVLITVSEGTRYQALTLEKTVIISPKTNTEAVKTSQTAIFGNALTVLELPDGIEGSWSWLETEIGEVGTRTFTAVYTPDENGNYSPREVPVTVTVNKISIKVPGVYDTQYTGEEKDTGLRDTDNYTVSGDIKATDAGNYSVTFTLTDPDHYEWFGDETKVSVTRGYKISNALNTWENEPEDMTVEYTGEPVYMTGKATHGTEDGMSYVYLLDGVEVTAPVSVGTYKVIITASATNYDDLVAERTIVITQQSVPLPTVPATLTYNGGAHSIPITDTNLNKLYTVTSEVKGTDTGDKLSTVLTLKDTHNYKWATTTAAYVTVESEIVKHTVSFTGATTVSKSEWTYLDAEGVVTAAPLDAASVNIGITPDLLYSYNGGSFVTFDKLAKTEGKLNAGSYTVKSVIPADKNWDGVQTAEISFVIHKVTGYTVTVSWPSAVADGSLYYQNLLGTPKSTVTYNGAAVELSATCGYAISSAGFQGADTKYTFTVNPKDTVNYAKVGIDVAVPLKTVATIGHGGTAYGSIESALAAANTAGSGVVWVIPDVTGNLKIVSDVTVNSGVTLRLPYGPGASDYNSTFKASENDTVGSPAEKNAATYRKLRVILAEGKNITVEDGGKLEVAGKFIAGSGFVTDYCGHTGKDYAILEMAAGSTLDIKGRAEVFGYIRELDYNDKNGSSIHLYSTAVLYQPYTMRDYRTGNYFSIVNDSKGKAPEEVYAPFARFTCMNISPFTKIDAGAHVYANANIHSTLGYTNTTACMIGTTESLLKLTTGYMEFRYDVDEDVMYVHLYGGADLGNFSMDTGVTGGGALSTKDFPMTFTYHMNVILDTLPGQTEAVYNMGDENEQFKMFPGFKMTVEEGVTLNVTRLNIYDNSFVDSIGIVDKNNTDTVTTQMKAYPSGKGDAVVTVRGKLTAKELGGKIHTDTDGAKIYVSGATTVTNKEIMTFTADYFSSKAIKTQYVTNKLQLYYDGKLVKEGVMSEVEYTSDSSKKNWTFVMPETIDVPLSNGYGVYAEFAVLTDSLGEPYVGVYDSRSTKQNGTITIVKGTEITFYLTKNQLAVLGGATSTTLDVAHPLISGTGDYGMTWIPGTDAAPVVYNVPSFTLGVSGVTGTVAYTGLSTDGTMATATVTLTVSNKIYTNGKLAMTLSGITVTGDTFTSTGKTGTLEGGTYTIAGDSEKGTSVSITATFTVSSDLSTTVSASSEFVEGDKPSCVTPDTLITLADGTQVRVDSLTGDEMLLVWNLETGRFDLAPIMFIDSEAMAEFEVIYLYFSDGSVVKVISEHGFWDYDLGRYVYLDRDAADYIGHSFARQDGDALVRVQLTGVELRTEMTTAWSPVTVGHLCYFVNGMLSMPGGVGGLFNIFEVDEETMTYDLEAIERDIATYGLFTYEELNAICPLSRDMFDAAGGAYMKISIGKGNLTMEELIAMIERYSVYFE